MNTIRERMDTYLETVVGASRVSPSPVSRFHCWHTTDQLPYTTYDWMGKVIGSGMRTRDVYIWIGAHGAVYLTGILCICPNRPRSTIQSSVVTGMFEFVNNSFRDKVGQ